MKEKSYITIAGIQYYTTKDIIKAICISCGFNKVIFKIENISGKFRQSYYTTTFKHSFNSFADKLKASREVKVELNKLEVV